MKTKAALILAVFLGLSFVPLNAFARDFPYASFGGHTERTRGVAFSGDGAMLASGSDDHSLILWDVSTGNKLRSIRNFDNSYSENVYSVSVNPDGQIVASAGHAYYRTFGGLQLKTLRLWDVSTGEILWDRLADTNYTLAVAFSPDGEMIASGGDEHTIKLWDVSTGDLRRKLVGHSDEVTRIAFSADGQLLASASADKTVRLWEVNTSRSLHTFARHSEAVYGVAISPDGLTVASGSGDGTIGVWDVTTSRHLHILTGHEGGVGPVVISTDGQTVISGGADGTIRLWVQKESYTSSRTAQRLKRTRSET